MIGWLRCREAAQLASQGLDRELSFGERVRLRAHLAVCGGCSNFEKQILYLRRALRELQSRET